MDVKTVLVYQAGSLIRRSHNAAAASPDLHHRDLIEETCRDDLILEDPSRVSERLIRSDCSPDRSPGHPGMLPPPGIAAPISMIGYGS